jgi:hypothetical protein
MVSNKKRANMMREQTKRVAWTTLAIALLGLVWISGCEKRIQEVTFKPAPPLAGQPR